MPRWWKESVLFAALLSGCGGRANEPGAEGTAGSGPNLGAGAPSTGASAGTAEPGADAGTGAGGAAASSAGSGTVAGAGTAVGGAGSGQGSAGASSQASADCDASTPLQQGGGYLQCEGRLLHRPKAGTCKSSLPRAVSETPVVFDECRADTDCSAMPHGFCAYGACKSGCVTDAECPSDQACFCGPDIGACVPATCHDDADCPSQLPCVAYVQPGFSLPDALACQSPVDQCLTTPQCNSLNPRVSCRFQVDHRVCYQDKVS